MSGGRTIDSGVGIGPTPTTTISITVGGWVDTLDRQQHLVAGIVGVTTLDGCWCELSLHPAATKGRLRVELVHLTRLETEEQSLFSPVAVGTNKEADFSKRNNQILHDSGADCRTRGQDGAVRQDLSLEAVSTCAVQRSLDETTPAERKARC